MYDPIVYRGHIVRRCQGVALSRACRTNVVITAITAVAAVAAIAAVSAVSAVAAVVGVRVLKHTKNLFEKFTVVLKDRPLSVR